MCIIGSFLSKLGTLFLFKAVLWKRFQNKNVKQQQIVEKISEEKRFFEEQMKKNGFLEKNFIKIAQNACIS